MKILLFLLLLYAAVKLTNPQCTSATVDMSRVQQNGVEGDIIILNFDLECPVTEAIFTISLSYSNKETEVTDYSGPATVNIPTGVTFFSTLLSLSEDNIVEIDERFCVVIDSVGSTAVPTAGNFVILDTVTEELTTTVTIEDDDTATVSIFSDTQVNEGTGADSTATVTLGWSSFFEDPGFTVGLSYDLSNGSLEAGDLTTGVLSYTLSLSGTSSIEIPIVIHPDAVVEDDEFLTISITNASEPSGYPRTDAIFVDLVSDEVVVTVLDDDTLSVSFTTDQSANEGSIVEVAFLFSNSVEDADTFSFSYTVISSDAEAIDYSLLGGIATTPIVVPTLTSDLTYTILFLDDIKAEDDETVSLSLTAFFSNLVHRTGGGVITGGSKLTFAATIQDNDDAELTLSPTSPTVGEGTDYTQTILLDRQVEDDGYSVTLNVIADTAAGGSDFWPSGVSSYAIPACVSSFEVAVAIIDDDLVEDCESLSVSILGISTPVGFRADVLDIGTDSLASVTIEDNDTATIGIRSIGTFTESAGSTGTITLTVTGMLQAGDEYTATLSLTDDNTDGANDYTGDLFEVTLSSATDTATVEVPIVNNNNFEDYETFTAAITSVSPPSTFKRDGSGDTFVINTQENNLLGEIEDDDTVTFSFASTTQTVNESTSVTVSICSDNIFEDDNTYTLSFDYLNTELDTAGMYIDYVEVPTFIVPPWTNKYSFSFTVSGDAWVEDDESVTLSFNSLIYPHKRRSGVFFSATSSTSVITVDDDDTAEISMVSSALQITEDDLLDVTGTISLQMDAIILIPGFSVTLTWVDDTAIDGTGDYDDYNQGSTVVAVETATNTQGISYVVVSNLIVEDHESFTVSLLAVNPPPTLVRGDIPVVSINPASSTTVVTINDDDTATFCFDSVSTMIEGASMTTISYTIDSTLEDSFYVELTFTDGTATQVDDYINSDGERVDIPSMGTFVTTSSITLSTDDKIEDDETFSVRFGTPTASGTFSRMIADAIVFTGGCNSLTVTIYDDDTVTIEMDLRDIDVNEDFGNAIVNVDIYGGELCFEGYTATISYDDVTTDGSDYVASVAVSIPTYTGTSSQFTFLLPIADDDIVEDNELVHIILSCIGSPASVTRISAVVITDVAIDQTTNMAIMDDDTATLTVSSDMECATEGDSYGTINLTLDKQVQDNGFIFDLVYQDIDALAIDDYHNTDTQGDVATLTSLFTFTFSLSSDNVVESEQSLSLSLTDVSEPAHYTRTDAIFLHATDRTATVTIKDDDTATVSLASSKVTVSEGAGFAEVVVSWSNPIEDPTMFSATLAYTDGTAVHNDDYTSGISTTALPIEPTTDLIVTVDLTDDMVVEDHEEFTVQLTGVSDPLTTNSLKIDNTQDTTEVCIQDDDTAPCPERAVVEMSSGVFTSVQLPEPLTGPQTTFIDANGDPVSQDNFMVGITTAVRRNDGSLCLQNIIIIDASPPEVMSCSEDIIRELKLDEKNISVNWREPSATDVEGGTVTMVSTHKPGDLFTNGVTTVVYTFCDSSNNLANCTFRVIVTESKEDEPTTDDVPVIKDCYSNSQIVEVEEGQKEYNVKLQLPPITDMTSSSPVKEENFTVILGFNELLYNFSDADGNRAACLLQILVAATNTSQKKVVFDDCPRSITVNTTYITNFSEVFWTEPVAPSPAIVNRSPLPDDTFFEEITVTYTAEVNGIVTDKCSFVVNIADVTPPVILNCPSDINATLCRGARTVHWYEPYAVDNSNKPVHVFQTHEPLKTPFKIGTTRVTYMFEDDSENVAACHFNVNVRKSQTCRPFSLWSLLVIILILTVAVIILLLICAVCLSCDKEANDNYTENDQEAEEMELN